MRSHLHGDNSVINVDLLGQEVGTNGGLVLVAEATVDVLVHEGGLADTVTPIPAPPPEPLIYKDTTPHTTHHTQSWMEGHRHPQSGKHKQGLGVEER